MRKEAWPIERLLYFFLFGFSFHAQDGVEILPKQKKTAQHYREKAEICFVQCCGAMTFWYGSGSADTIFFKDEKSKKRHKTVGIKVFLTIFA